MPTDENKLEFEESLSRLESIVGQLESGELGLEDSIANFESGVNLYKECKTLLDEAQKKISVLTDSLKEEPLD